MTIRIDKNRARQVLFEEAKRAETLAVPAWEEEVERLSLLCRDLGKTHIAFLGTSMLAKATDLRADTLAIKLRAATPGAYSARTLCHGVLVPNSIELGIDLGVTGREPLNNQPYWRSDQVSREMAVLSSLRPALEAICEILERLQRVESEEEARAALRAFIRVRRRYLTVPKAYKEGAFGITLPEFISAVELFVSEESEGGKRAQAVAAGLASVSASPELVVAGRVNDPDRHLPGDVGIRALRGHDWKRAEEVRERSVGQVDLPATAGHWERVFEVRDKAVDRADLFLFARKAAEAGVGKAAVIAVAAAQEELPVEEAVEWAAERGVLLQVYCGWSAFIPEVLFWAPDVGEDLVAIAHRYIYERLLDVEASAEAADQWLSLASHP